MKISVIMPFYNSEKTILSSLESFKNQTIFKKYNDIIIDFICINNNSNDRSYDICNKFLDTIEINGKKQLLNCHIQGISPAANFGIYESFKNNFDYLAILHSDDEWFPEKLTKQIEYINLKKVDIIGTQIIIVDENNNQISKSEYPIEDIDIKNHIINGINPIANSSSLINKDVFVKCGSYDFTYNLAEDFHLWIKARKYFYFYNIPEYLTKYRLVHKNNYVSTVGKICLNNFNTAMRMFHNE